LSTGEKTALRSELRRQRGGLSENVRQAASKQICQSILRLEALKGIRLIGGYRAYGSEVNVDEALAVMLLKGVAVALPKVAPGRELEWRPVMDLERDFEPGAFGIQEPTTPPLEQPEEIEVVLTPGVGFDRSGGRLGSGKGYYDTFFQGAGASAVRIGVAYSFQVAARMPTDRWDQAMDWIVTEDEVICCRQVRELGQAESVIGSVKDGRE
jgi:5-formyltetrahydrofolate cyclo-ligase